MASPPLWQSVQNKCRSAINPDERYGIIGHVGVIHNGDSTGLAVVEHVGHISRDVHLGVGIVSWFIGLTGKGGNGEFFGKCGKAGKYGKSWKL